MTNQNNGFPQQNAQPGFQSGAQPGFQPGNQPLFQSGDQSNPQLGSYTHQGNQFNPQEQTQSQMFAPFSTGNPMDTSTQPNNAYPPFFDGSQGVHSPTSSGGYYENSPGLAGMGGQGNSYSYPFAPANPHGAAIPGMQGFNQPGVEKKNSATILLIVGVCALVLLVGGGFTVYSLMGHKGSSHNSAAGSSSGKNSSPSSGDRIPESSNFNPCSISPATLQSSGFNGFEKSTLGNIIGDSFKSSFQKTSGITLQKICVYSTRLSFSSDDSSSAPNLGVNLFVAQDDLDPSQRKETIDRMKVNMQYGSGRSSGFDSRMVKYANGYIFVGSAEKAVGLGNMAMAIAYSSNGRLVAFNLLTSTPEYKHYGSAKAMEDSIIKLSENLN